MHVAKIRLYAHRAMSVSADVTDMSQRAVAQTHVEKTDTSGLAETDDWEELLVLVDR